MNNLSIPTKKFFLNIINKFNSHLSNKLSYLSKENLSQFFKSIIYDRRIVITLIISFLSIFAHLSTPAFYQDKWVLGKIKTQLEKEFNLKFVLPEIVDYSIFPVPSFHLKHVRLIDGGEELGKIDKMVLHLSFSKFLNKEKINIQYIHIKNSKFNIYYKDIKNLLNFFDKKINEKKLLITDSKIFFKNNDDEIYSIISLDKIISNYDDKTLKNFLKIKGNIFNNLFDFNFSNDPIQKIFYFDLGLKEVGKKIKSKIDYLNNNIIGELDFIVSSNSYLSKIEFNKINNRLIFNSEKKINENYHYKADIILNPFFAVIEINLNKINLFDLFDKDKLFYKIISSNLINNKNINYKIKIKSENIANHRLLKKFLMQIDFKNSKLDFDNTKFIFDNNVEINLKNSEYVYDLNNNFLKGDLNFKIKNIDTLYKYFQTNKKFRKKMKEINLSFEVDFTNNSYFIHKIYIDNKTNNQIENLIDYHNKNNFKSLRRIEIKNFFNEIVSNF